MSLIDPLAPEKARALAVSMSRSAADADRLRRARELAARLRATPAKPAEPAVHPAVLELPKWWQGSTLANAQLYWIEALKHGEYGENPPRITTPVILAVVAERHGIAIDRITGPSRSREVIMARFEAVYLIRAITKRSFNDFKRVFGRDHTTMTNACARYAERAGLPLVDDIGREQAIGHMVRQIVENDCTKSAATKA